MRILYGVVGEGMGHATRSRVVLEHLVAAGHEVEVVVSGRAADMLASQFPDRVHRITGMTMVYEHNEVHKRKTLLENARSLFSRGLPGNIKVWFDLVADFSPQLVISDFETWSWLFAVNHRIPLISIDNMQALNRCKHNELASDPRWREQKGAFRLARAIVKAKIPGAAHYFVTTFFYPPLRRKRTTLVPPILRPEILAARATAERGDHVLVYQTGGKHEALVEAMRARSDLSFLVYGMERELKEDRVDGNLVFRPFSQQGFVDDLASARAVVAGGGFSLMGECVYLGKPMLAVPMRGQFEQVLNAMWLERLGYGLYRDVADADGIDELLGRDTELAYRLQDHRQDGNRELLAGLDSLLQTLEIGGGRTTHHDGADEGADEDDEGDDGDGAPWSGFEAQTRCALGAAERSAAAASRGP